MDSRRGERIAIHCRTKGPPHLRLNISQNLTILPENLLGLIRPVRNAATRAEIGFQVFSAQSCTRLAGPYMDGPHTENILRDLTECGASQWDALTGFQAPASIRHCLHTICVH